MKYRYQFFIAMGFIRNGLNQIHRIFCPSGYQLCISEAVLLEYKRLQRSAIEPIFAYSTFQPVHKFMYCESNENMMSNFNLFVPNKA